MSNVVPFNRRIAPATWNDGRVQNECDKPVHLFATVPGRCQCGEHQWTDQPGTEEPGQPSKETPSSDAHS